MDSGFFLRSVPLLSYFYNTAQRYDDGLPLLHNVYKMLMSAAVRSHTNANAHIQRVTWEHSIDSIGNLITYRSPSRA